MKTYIITYEGMTGKQTRTCEGIQSLVNALDDLQHDRFVLDATIHVRTESSALQAAYDAYALPYESMEDFEQRVFESNLEIVLKERV